MLGLAKDLANFSLFSSFLFFSLVQLLSVLGHESVVPRGRKGERSVAGGEEEKGE